MSQPPCACLTPCSWQVSLQFFDRERRAAKGWLGSTLGAPPDDRQFWETWCLPLAVAPAAALPQQPSASAAGEPCGWNGAAGACCGGGQAGAGRAARMRPPRHAQTLSAGSRRTRLQAQLEEIITLIVRTVNDNRDHIPPVVNNNVLPFPYELKVGQ